VKNLPGRIVNDLSPLILGGVGRIQFDTKRASGFGLCDFQCVVPQKESGWKVYQARVLGFFIGQQPNPSNCPFSFLLSLCWL
jgi:hypothetical protein